MSRNDEMELDDPPRFEIGEKVQLTKMIRNDGTFAGVEIGARLARKGDTGYVVSIGTFLQTAYIYAVHFLETGRVVGCRSRELISCDHPPEIGPENGSAQNGSTAIGSSLSESCPSGSHANGSNLTGSEATGSTTPEPAQEPV